MGVKRPDDGATASASSTRACADLNSAQAEIAEVTNLEHVTGTLADAVKGADVFIGVSAPGVVTAGNGASPWPRIPSCSPWPTPPPKSCPTRPWPPALRVVGTGRSDFPNQINNVLAFPGIFRGALDVRARPTSTSDMKVAAAYAIAGIWCTDDEL